MIERWRRWRWHRYERQVSKSDNFAEFERLFSGAVTPDMASKMPLDMLLDKRSEQVGQETRAIIDTEINRRLNSKQGIIANVIAAIALIVSVIALSKTL